MRFSIVILVLALIALAVCAPAAAVAAVPAAGAPMNDALGPRLATPRVTDTTAPVVTATVSPAPNTSGWTTSAEVTITLTATDAESGVAGIEYAPAGTTAWTAYTAPIVVTSEGSTTFQFRATNTAGKTSTVKKISARIDRTPPLTVVEGVPSGWVDRMVGVGFAATDSFSGMSGGAAKTEYSTDGGRVWSTGDSALVSGQGVNAVLYRSIDAAGNVEAVKSVNIRIDSASPVTKAHAANVHKGKKVTLSYVVTDPKPGCGRARATVAIMKGKRRAETIPVAGTVKTNTKHTLSWRCTLPRGRYTIKVYATDIAGNPASRLEAAVLKVK